MSSKRHWFKWYPADWRGEPSLRMVSRAARSVWIDMLGLMSEATPMGYLYLNGKKPTPEQLAKVLGDDIRDLAGWLEELKEAGVYSETEDGVVFSRKMVRDAERAEKGRSDATLRGGAWAKTDKNSQRVPNSTPNKDPNGVASGVPNSYMPEARSQKKDTVGPGTPEPTASKAYSADFEEFWIAYPRSPNMSKAEAWKSWAKLKAANLLPDKPAMAKAVAAYRKFLADQSKGRKDPHPAAHAATWLNQRRFEGFLEAPATPVGATVPTGPGWEAEYPETWGKVREGFRKLGSDQPWLNWFAGCRPNGSPYTLVCRSQHDRDAIEQRFGDNIARLFGHPVTFIVGGPQAGEARH